MTLDELRDILQDNPQALAVLETTTIEELMAKYDINNDGSLSRAEVRSLSMPSRPSLGGIWEADPLTVPFGPLPLICCLGDGQACAAQGPILQ